MGAHACHMEDPIGYIFRGRLLEWHEDQMFRWGHTQGLSTDIHILCRLPRKVRPQLAAM